MPYKPENGGGNPVGSLSGRPRLAAFVACVLVSMLLLLAACGGGASVGIGGVSKANIAEETWECLAKNAEDSETFEEIMMRMYPTAGSLGEAKEMYVYVSSAAPIEELEAARDDACGAD